MNRIFSLCLPVAVSAIMLSQVSAQAQAQNNKFNYGRGGGGGRPAAVAAAPRMAAPQMAAPRVSTPHFAPRPSMSGFAGARPAQRNFAMPSRNVTAARSFTPQRSVQAPTIAHNPVLNGGRSFNRSNRNLALGRQFTPNAAASANVNRFSGANRFGNTNRVNVARAAAVTPNALATRRQIVGAVNRNSAIVASQFAFRAGNFHPGWNQGRSYHWNNHNWRCYNGVWAVADVGWPSDWYGYPYPFAYNNVVYYGGDVYDPADYSETAYYAAPQPSVVGSNLVADVQSALDNAGYNAGPADGDAGPQTREAVAGYQQDHGMTPTGRIDGPLLDSLGL